MKVLRKVEIEYVHTDSTDVAMAETIKTLVKDTHGTLNHLGGWVDRIRVGEVVGKKRWCSIHYGRFINAQACCNHLSLMMGDHPELEIGWKFIQEGIAE